jgi:transcriptional regulator with XRE-family HTH domain
MMPKRVQRSSSREELNMARKTKPSKLDEMRTRGLENEGFREGYAARDALIRLGEMLQQLREASGLTQSQLAGRVGMTQPAVSRIESGLGSNGPEIDTVMRYMHGCDFELVIGAKHKVAKARKKSAATTSRLVATPTGLASLTYKTVL